MQVLISSGTLTDIASAIRAKTGKPEKLYPREMPGEIAAIEGGEGTRYVVGDPTEFVLSGWDADEDGHTKILNLGDAGLQVGPAGAQIGLMPGSSVANTKAVVDAVLSLAGTAAPGSTSLSIVAVNIPQTDLTVAIFGLEVKPPEEGES